MLCQTIASLVYSPENMQRAAQYMATRGLSFEKLAVAWTCTGPDPEPLKPLEQFGLGPASTFTNMLFIPITAIDDPTGTRLIGFDGRRVDKESNDKGIRYRKFKDDKLEAMIYNMARALNTPPDEPIITTEGAIDAESVQQATGITTISTLSTSSYPSTLATLLALTKNPLIMFDNNDAGRTATKRLIETSAVEPDISQRIRTVPYMGSDPNAALTNPILGAQSLKAAVDKVLAQL